MATAEPTELKRCLYCGLCPDVTFTTSAYCTQLLFEGNTGGQERQIKNLPTYHVEVTCHLFGAKAVGDLTDVVAAILESQV